MKFSFRQLLMVTLVCAGFSSTAQNLIENALLFSRTSPNGSARIQAIGGAQIALGGDFSSALSNPAGLGMYNRSEFTFTPAIGYYNTQSNYNGTSSDDSKSVFNIPGLSLVYCYPQDKNGFFGGSVSISMTRINDFNRNFNYSGVDNGTSISDWMIEQANGKALNELPFPYQNTPLIPFDLPVELGYYTTLINPFNEEDPYPDPFTEQDFYDYTHYFSELERLPDETRTFTRNQQVERKGSQYQWSFAYGGNYKDKIFFGGNLGITTLQYSYSGTYGESDYSFSLDNQYDPLQYLALDEEISIDGTGVNLTLGLIYRPLNFVQLGASFVTPTSYKLSRVYTSSLRTQWNDNRGFLEASSLEDVRDDYKLSTPMKFSTGAAFFFGKFGFITADVEFVNYGKSKYKKGDTGISTGIPLESYNNVISNSYADVVNYRMGAEYRLSKFRFRGGYNVMTDPYASKSETNYSIKTISLGTGVRLTKVFFDFTWLQSKGNNLHMAYLFNDGSGPSALIEQKTSTFMLTGGYLF
jgi:hypothetical protein